MKAYIICENNEWLTKSDKKYRRFNNDITFEEIELSTPDAGPQIANAKSACTCPQDELNCPLHGLIARGDAGPSSPNAVEEQLAKALTGMIKYWEWMIKDPHFKEYKDAKAAIDHYQQFLSSLPTTEGQSSPVDAVKFAEFIADNYWERNEDYMWFKNPPLKIWVENRDEAQHTTEQLYQQFLTSQK